MAVVTDRYIPQPVRDLADIIAEKDAEITKLKEMVDNMSRRINALEGALYAVERQQHVDMGR